MSSRRIELFVHNRNGAGPSGRRAADLNREAANRKTTRRRRLQIVQFLQMTVADLVPSLVPLPDQPGIAGLGIAFFCVQERESQLQPSVPVRRTPRSSR